MSEGLRALAAFAGAAVLVGVLTPVAIKLAVRTSFLDRPSGYKAHSRTTPYLGGAAVVAAFLAVAVLLGDGLGQFATVLGLTVVLLGVGTLDDRRNLGITIRLAVQAGAALALWAAGIGWAPTGVEALDLVVSVVWVVGIANAFNLLDNIDGSTGATAGTCAAGIGALALIEGAPMLAALAFALSGACFGFLRYNLAQPARIFLGDGGSLPIGFLLATMAMLVPSSAGTLAPLLAAVPMLGVAIFDTSLVVVSRLRRNEPVLSGGRDHLTHRLLGVLGSPLAVAGVLIVVQGLLSGLGVIVSDLENGPALLIAVGYGTAGLALLVRLETAPFSPRSSEQPLEQQA